MRSSIAHLWDRWRNGAGTGLEIVGKVKERRSAMIAERIEERVIAEQYRERSYAAAKLSRLTEDWYTALLSADQEMRGDSRRLRGAARAAVRDTAFASRYVRMYSENVIGDKGIQLQAKTRTADKTKTLNTALNDQIEAAWCEWGYAENCSVDGRLNWVGMQDLTARTEPQDGEYLIRIIRGADNPFLFALQPLDVDLIDDQLTLEAERAPNGNEIRMGVEVNIYGKPVAYWCWTRHPSDTSSRIKQERIRIPADEIIHDFVTLRPGQSRGVTWFAPVLLNHNMLAAYIEAEITAARIGASNMAAIQYDPEKGGGGLPKAQAGQGAIPLEVEPGRFLRLNPGESLAFTDFGHPSGAFGPFLKYAMRAEATGLNVAYSSLSGDLEAVNFSSIRAGILQERDFYRFMQQRTVERFCRRVFAAWLPMAVLAGKLPSVAQQAVMQPRAIQWRPRGWAWVDPLNEIQAATAEVQLGTLDRTTIAGERGRDFEEVLAQQAEEKRIAKEHGILLGADPAIQQTIAEVKNPDMPGAKKPGAAPAAGDSTDSEDDDSEDAADRARPVTLIRRHGT